MLFLISCSTQQTLTTSNHQRVDIYNIYDMYGEKLYQVNTLDTENLQSGVYYIQIIGTDDSPYWSKLVKVNF
jgi:hypothetical protein